MGEAQPGPKPPPSAPPAKDGALCAEPSPHTPPQGRGGGRPLQAAPARRPLPTAGLRACGSARSQRGPRECQADGGRPAAPAPAPQPGGRWDPPPPHLPLAPLRRAAQPTCVPPLPPGSRARPFRRREGRGRAEKSPSHRLLEGGGVTPPPFPLPFVSFLTAWARGAAGAAARAPPLGEAGAALLPSAASPRREAAGPRRAALPRENRSCAEAEGKGARWRRAWGAGP